MLNHGGKLAFGAIVAWILAMFGIDFFSGGGKFPKIQLPDPHRHVGTDSQSSNTTHAGNDVYVTGRVPPGWSRDQLPLQTNRPPLQRVEFRRTQDLLAIGSFNIQVFGESKANNQNVMAILVDIARQFDVLAIQEVRSKNQNLIPYFVHLINLAGYRYDYVIGARQGNSSSKEQYVYIYDTDRVEVVNSSYLVSDPNNWMHREPLVSSFRTRTYNGGAPFTFKLMNVHTDPDVVPQELAALKQFIDYEVQIQPFEDDLIILGDLNAAPDKFGKLTGMPGIAVAIPPNVATNTRGTRNYDNLVFNRHATTEYVAGGVLDMMQTYNLSMQQALLVSDHQPVWGLFRVNEMPPPGVASMQPNLR